MLAMKFSLRTFLIAVSVVGAVAGLMGSLLLNRPEDFLNVVRMCATILPFMLAVGTIVVVGLQRERRPRLVAWGVFLFLFPIAMHGAMAVLLPTGEPLRLWSTKRIITQGLPSRIEEPWVWRELQRRLDGGTMTAAEVDEAISVLVSHMKTTRPGGWNQPMPWQDPFLKAALSKQLVSEDVLLQLCDAFYGAQPTVWAITPMAKGAGGFRVHVEYGNPWAANLGVGVALLWEVTQVSVDGVAVKTSQVQRSAQNWDAYCTADPAAGDHEVQIDLVCAYAAYNKIIGGDPSQVPVSRWPATRKKWTVRLTTPLKVIASGK
jgi:hypothetical protein